MSIINNPRHPLARSGVAVFFIWLVCSLLVAIPAVNASHYRGAAASYTINSSGVLTVTAYTGWGSSPTAPSFRVGTGAGGTGTALGNMTRDAVNSVAPFSSGTEFGGSAYTTRKDIYTFNLSGQPAGHYYVWWTSAAYVSGINNLPASTWSLELKVAYTPGQASGGPTMLPVTIDLVGRGYPYTQNLNSTDPDGTPVTYENLVGNVAPDYAPTSLIPGISISASGTVSIPGSSTATMALGRWGYKIRVTDGSGGTAIRDVLIVAADPTSSNVNQPPVLASIGPKTVAVGSPLTFAVSGTDPDTAQTLTVRSSTLPSGASFPQASGAASGTSSNFSWTPSAGQEGTYVINFEVYDNASVTLIDSEEVTITVTGDNHPPVLAAVGAKTVANGSTLSFNLSATDEDNDNITYQMFNGPSGATLSAGGAFSWTPIAGQYNSTFAGVTFRATDDGTPNLYDEEAITITVGSGNNQPLTAATLTHTVSAGQNLSFTVTGTDADAAQTLTLTSNSGVPSGATFATATGSASAGVSSVFSWTPTVAQAGVTTVKFLTQDNGSPTLNHEITVTITVTAASGEMDISGNSTAIASGDTTPAEADHTDFGKAMVLADFVERTFTLANSGTGSLTLTGTAPNYVTLTGANADQFSVTTQPAAGTVAGSASTTFVVRFDPSSSGVKNATVSIASDDSNENPYTFAITGNGVAPEPVPSVLAEDVVTAGLAPNPAGNAAIGSYDILRRGGFLGENGRLVFPGYLAHGSGSPAVTAADDSGLWKEDGAGLYLIARTNHAAPQTGGAVFATLPEVPAIAQTGEASFLGTLLIGSGTPAVTSADDTGLWSELGGSGLSLLLRENDPVPGLPGVLINKFASGVYATARTGASTGEAVFSVTFKGADTRTAILRASVNGATTGVSVVAREGSAAPGTSPSVNFANVAGGFSDPARMDAQGNVVFSALTTPGSKEGIWYQPAGGSLAKVFFAGDTAPGTIGATFSRIQRPAMGGNNFITFRGILNKNGDNSDNLKNDGIWVGNPANPASFTCVLRRGDGSAKVANLPAGDLVGNPWGGWLTRSNRGAWKAWLDVGGNGSGSTTAGDRYAIFANLSGSMLLVLQSGDTAPGTAAATFSGFDLPWVGGDNQYALLGNLAGGDTTASNNQGLWRSAPNGGPLSLVLRKGQSITTTEGVKVVQKIDVPGSNQTDRRWEQTVMDNTGRMVVYVTFDDGTTSQMIIP